MARKIFVEYQGYKRHIGDWEAKYKVFSKQVMKSKHFFRVLGAWAMDSAFLNKMPEEALIKITDVEENKIYRVKAKKFRELGQYYHFKNENQDHKTQLFLKLEHWDMEDCNTDEWKFRHGHFGV